MVLLKIAMAGAAIVALMFVAQNQRWPQRAGVVGVCTGTPAPPSQPGGAWYACTQGILSGFPNLEADACDSLGIVGKHEIWRCTAPLVSLPGA
jgi:hypothetical protein